MTSGYVAIVLYEFDPPNGGFTRYNNPRKVLKCLMNPSQPEQNRDDRAITANRIREASIKGIAVSSMILKIKRQAMYNIYI